MENFLTDLSINSEHLVTGGVIIVLLALSGIFSGSETALTAASRARIHQLSQGRRQKSKPGWPPDRG